jgi:site-specific DNA recombinase
MATQATVHCRISVDRGRQGLGVARQRKDCEALIEREGWDLAGVSTDNDLSAFSGRTRPGYEQMLKRRESSARRGASRGIGQPSI